MWNSSRICGLEYADYLHTNNIPSSSSSSCEDVALRCSDLALDDYLRSYHISSSSSTSCFDLALDFLEKRRLEYFYECRDNLCFDEFESLDAGIRLLKTIFLYVRKCRRKHQSVLEYDLQKEDKGYSMSNSLRRSIICFRIQDLVAIIIHDIQSAHLIYEHSEAPFDIFFSALYRSRKNMMLFLETDIKGQCISFLLEHYHSPGGPKLVMDLVDSLLLTLKFLVPKVKKQLKLKRSLQENLMLLWNPVGLATTRGVDGIQMIDLLTHIEVEAARLISVCRFHGDDQVLNGQEIEISQLINLKINYLHPQLREAYIHVLTASKLSRPAYDLGVEGNKSPAADFVASLVHYLKVLLESYSSFPDPMKIQMLKLYKGVRFLKIILGSQQEKLMKLCDEMKDLIGLVVYDTGILIFSLSIDEMKEGLAKHTDLGLLNLLKVMECIMAEVAHIYPLTSPSSFSFPTSYELGSMDFFLQNLEELICLDEADNSFSLPLEEIQGVEEDLKDMRPFLESIKVQRYQNEKLQGFWSRVMEVVYKAELAVDSMLVGDKSENCLDAVVRDIKAMKIEAQRMSDSISSDCETKRIANSSNRMPSQIATPLNQDPVGLDDEVKTIIERIKRGSKKLDVVGIVGMPGLGKTTLANKVYTSPSIISHFYVCAWCCVSQTYSKHSLLVQILVSIASGSPSQYLEKDEDALAEQLRKVLLKNRYLLVLDDLWGIEVWNMLERSLPDDANGSRILFTSRIQNLSIQIKEDSVPYNLRQLTDKESWELLQRKLFGKKGCPPGLTELGFQLAKSCRGLPLTVILVAGIIATATDDCQEEVAKSLISSNIVYDDENCLKTVELSYSFLPEYLKPCFLYFGAFREDEEIPSRRLLQLWIGEGLVQQTDGMSLEEVADEYLMALTSRSLVMVTKQRTTGGAKACRVHDLVHEFCLKKAREESFLDIVDMHKDPLSLNKLSNPYRLCVYNTENILEESRLYFPKIRTLLFLESFLTPEEVESGFWLPKLLRVLDLRVIFYFESFPMEEVLFLVHLRFLVINWEVDSIPPAIANLSRLEFFQVENKYRTLVVLPNSVWNIKTLRHLRCWSGFSFPTNSLEVSPDLVQLVSLDLAVDDQSIHSLEEILTKLPCIRRLKLNPPREFREDNGILALDFLSRLESLTLNNARGYRCKFPLNLKKLNVYWADDQPLSEISKLPNLQVLKLGEISFVGRKWEMKEGEFPNLRVLMLCGLDIRSWTASSDNLSHMQKLILFRCPYLKALPSCLGESPALEMIEVQDCGNSVVNSVKEIQQEQMDLGNKGLQIDILYSSIYPHKESDSSEEESTSVEGESI